MFWLDEGRPERAAGAAAKHTRGQAWYSDAAIELVLMLRLVFHLALRQAEGFATSVLRLLGQTLRVPDHAALSRHSPSFAGRQPKVILHSPMHLLIDSTGLKLFGQGERDADKHGRTRRSWRKLHIAVNAGTGEIVACVLTDNAANDASQVPALLDAIKSKIASMTADGAYDGEPVYQAIATPPARSTAGCVTPPPASAVPSKEDAKAQSQRDHHIRITAEKGRMAWQRATDYGRRSLAETAVGRYKAIMGPKLRARILPAQRGKAAIVAEVFNRMIRVAKPISIRVA